jgi:repressor LexA
MNELTKRQKQIIDYVARQIASIGRPPTRQAIADNFGFLSPNAAQDHLVAIERKGFIRLGRKKARAIEVLQ